MYRNEIWKYLKKKEEQFKIVSTRISNRSKTFHLILENECNLLSWMTFLDNLESS